MSDSEDHLSSDDDFQSHAHLFKSSLDIGSHFIDIEPENELVFYNREGTLLSQLTVKNVTSKAYVAFLIFTSAPYPIVINPRFGFIPPMHQQTIQIGWPHNENPDADKLSHAMFFVKALPISQEMNVQEMNMNLPEVFNTYNMNILFTIAALPSRVALGLPMQPLIGGITQVQPPNQIQGTTPQILPSQKQAQQQPPQTKKQFNNEEQKEQPAQQNKGSMGGAKQNKIRPAQQNKGDKTDQFRQSINDIDSDGQTNGSNHRLV